MASSTSKDKGKRPVSVDDDFDIDELDGTDSNTVVLSSRATTSPPATSTAPSAAPPESSTESDDEAAEFANELARQMEDMLRGLATALDRQALQARLSDLAGDRPSTAEDSEDPFQTRLKAAMERLHLSDTGPPGDTSEDPNDDLAAFLGEDESMQNLLENMMSHLMCKDVLYEPLNELNDKFPSYLASNEGKLSESDLARYKAQHVCASKIVALFEDPGYKDDDPKMKVDIVALMSEMQEHGTPPAEIMGELPPGLNGFDGLPEDLSEKCVVT
ncbi:Pex19 protein family-domain-containing protein [Lactifluus volemus]|nr:Pex19 protein family-domain-containing protein [Lactifluus volemus]